MNTSEIFLNIDNLPGILNNSQLYELLEKAKANDKTAIKTIVEHNIRLVLYEVTNRFKSVEYD